MSHELYGLIQDAVRIHEDYTNKVLKKLVVLNIGDKSHGNSTPPGPLGGSFYEDFTVCSEVMATLSHNRYKL